MANFSILLAVIVFLSAQEVLTRIHMPCITPSREEGVCIDPNKCKALNAYTSSRSLSNDEVLYLNASRCKIEREKSVHICCPVKWGFTDGNTKEGIQQKISGLTESKKPIQDANPLLPVKRKCGVLIEDAIIKGIITDIYDFPWMALLQYQTENGKQFKCGGVLINDRYILTAAHCASNNLLLARLGEYDLRSNQDCMETIDGLKECNEEHQDIPIEEVISHESGDVDIALVRLKRKFVPNEFIQPICLPIPGNEPMVDLINKRLTISGWNGTSSNVKLRNTLKVLDNAECKNKLKLNLPETLMCAETVGTTNFCASDSGGPLMSRGQDHNYIVYGIYSFGINECSWPSVYTKVANYIDWIRQNVKP